MSGPAIALVVCAAVLHAIWNALAKRADNQFVFLWSSVSLATLLLLPAGLVRLPAEGTPAAGLPFVAASVAIHALYFYALGRSYRHGDFSRVYPMARGLGVALVPLVALPVFGERLSWLGALGVGFVVLGISMDGPETIASVAPFARQYNLTFPMLLDEETKVVAVYNPKRTAPLSVLIDRGGRIARVRQGYNPGDETLIAADVKQLLAQK